MRYLNVFLSHLTLERTLAETLQKAIDRDFIGLVQFFISSDTTSIPVGEKWARKMIEGLAESDLHVVLCSPESVKRPWINFETGAACLRDIPIIPVCHSGLNPRQLPQPLSQFESMIASDPKDLQKLYKRIASKLGSKTPDSGLDELVAEIKAFEAKYQKLSAVAEQCEVASTAVGIIQSPRVLCVTSKQFMALRSKDLEIIQTAFPNSVTHLREVTSQTVRNVLMHERFDIIHVATHVCPKTGDLVFSDVDLNSGERNCQPGDILPAAAFSSLVRNAQTKLVVIASCESFELGAELLSVSNVVVTRDMISVEMFAAWIESFYTALASVTLSEAFDYAVKATRAPMRLYAKQDFEIVPHREAAASATGPVQ